MQVLDNPKYDDPENHYVGSVKLIISVQDEAGKVDTVCVSWLSEGQAPTLSQQISMVLVQKVKKKKANTEN